MVGDLELDHETSFLSGDTGTALAVYSAAPGSASADASALLASWAATTEQVAETEADPVR